MVVDRAWDEMYQPWACAHVFRLVTSCPALRQLSVSADCTPPQLAQLSRLTGLRQLAVGVPGDQWCGSPHEGLPGWQPYQPVAEIAALAQLTSLQGLTLFTCCSLDHLVPLTRLEQLRSLTVRYNYDNTLQVGALSHCG